MYTQTNFKLVSGCRSPIKMNNFFLLMAIVFFTGCGYKPSSHYVKKTIGGKIYTEVRISPKDPEVMPLVVDAISEAIVSKYKSHLAKSAKDADSVVIINNAKFVTSGLQKDENGYTVLFRTTVVLDVLLRTKESEKKFKLSGSYDFAQTSDSVLSEEKKLSSYRQATIKALDSLTAKLAYIGAKYENR